MRTLRFLMILICTASILPSLALSEVQQQANQRIHLPMMINGAGDASVPTFTLGWRAPQTTSATSLAWGDYDNDGDLDLAVGNYSDPNQLYRNEEGNLVLAWTAPAAGSTTSLAWGDYDNDGDLDLAVGNSVVRDDEVPDLPNQVYRNEEGNFVLAWSAAEVSLRTGVDFVDTDHMAWIDYDNDGDLDLVTDTLIYRNATGSIDPQGITNGVDGPRFDDRPGDAWGDYDNDGDLDLASSTQPRVSSTQIQRNDSGTLVPVWQTPETMFSSSVAWADYDNDGDLDLAVAYNSLPIKLYRNELTYFRLAWNAAQVSAVQSLAWGDYDGDNDLDLAVGNGQDDPNQLYRNNAGALQLAWTAEGAGAYRSHLAWGDYDSDGDLDLAVGNAYKPSQIYRNDNGNLNVAWTASAVVHTSSIAWGDYDGDGDLDLALGNRIGEVETPNQLYRNDNGNFTLAWSAAIANFTEAVSWGDYDNDGDLDLVTGGFIETNQLYRNDNGSLSPLESGLEAGNTQGMAWGDYDGDGDLDLAVGNYGTASQIYRNDNGNLVVAWQDTSLAQTGKVAWGDADNDGDLDLALAGVGEPSSIYRNDQRGFSLAWQSSAPALTNDIAWADYDSDGDLDLSLGNSREFDNGIKTSQIYRNDSGSGMRLGATAARVTVERPVTAATANGYSTPVVLQGPITIRYRLAHPAGQPVRRILAFYSLNGGGEWLPATPLSDTQTLNLPAAPGGTQHTFGWNVAADGVTGSSDNVVVRIVALPGFTSRSDTFQTASNSAASPSFRLRGPQARVLRPDGRPVTGAYVYRLPAGQERGGQLTPPPRPNQAQLRTDQNGYLQGRGPLSPGDGLLAMEVISATDTYTLYHTSAAPSDNGLDLQPISASGVQTLTVSAAHPLVVFNLDLSLEWDARNDPAFLLQLEKDLKRAAELLYDWTDGQASLGDLTIYQDKERWNEANIRVYATNRLRPTAVKGGIVSAERADPDPNVGEPNYVPGQIRMGAVWNRYGEATANLGDDWARTLAHELGHYALFLDDNYLGLDDQGRLIAVEGCRGSMSDPYRDDYGEFHPSGTEWEANCANTLSQRLVGRSDWETIKAFYDLPTAAFVLNEPLTFGALPGPRTLPLEITRIRRIGLAGPPSRLDAPVYLISGPGGAPLSPPTGSSARAFLFQSRAAAEGGDRLVDLGRPTGEQILARGTRPGDSICVFEPDQSRLGCRTTTANYQPLTLANRPDWQPDIALTPVTSTTLRLSISGLASGLSLRARLYPSAAPAGSEVILSENGAGGYVADILSSADNPALEGLLHLWVAEAEPRRETVVDFAVGGNPGRVRSRAAPRGNPGRVRSRAAPVLSSDGQAILFVTEEPGENDVYALQSAASPPPPPSYATPISRAYRLMLGPGVSLNGASLNLGYLGDDVAPGQESGITLYRWNAASAAWQPLPTYLDRARNEATANIANAGIYQLMTSLSISLPNPGWNPIYFYPGATQPVEAALAGIAGRYTTVYGYAATDANDPWKVYDTSVPQWVNELDVLTYGDSYWLRTSEALTLPIRGAQPLTTMQTSDTGYISLPPATYYAAFAVQEEPPPVGSLVTARVNGVLCGQAFTRSVGSEVVFAIDVAVAGGGDTIGCGRPGLEVRISVGEKTFSVPWDNSRPQSL